MNVQQLLSPDHKTIVTTMEATSPNGTTRFSQEETYLGACPVPMRPGQAFMLLMRGDDGRWSEWDSSKLSAGLGTPMK